jgi:amino acid transporter
MNILGQVAGVAASEWGAALLLLAAVSISSDFTYVPTINQTVATMAGLVVVSGLANSLSTYWMEKMTRSYVIFHVLVLVSCAIALLVRAQPENGTPKHTAKYVFTNVENQSGWSPLGWSFMFGFLSVSWTMCKLPVLSKSIHDHN